MFETHVGIYAVAHGPGAALFRAKNLQGIHVQAFIRDELREYCSDAFYLLANRSAAGPGRSHLMAGSVGAMVDHEEVHPQASCNG